MALANCGYLPPHPLEVDVVFKFILPLAIPLLLLSANLFRILRETGPLLAAFLLGTATTVVSSYLGACLCMCVKGGALQADRAWWESERRQKDS
jgi:uncharacterized membrane protein